MTTSSAHRGLPGLRVSCSWWREKSRRLAKGSCVKLHQFAAEKSVVTSVLELPGKQQWFLVFCGTYKLSYSNLSLRSCSQAHLTFLDHYLISVSLFQRNVLFNCQSFSYWGLFLWWQTKTFLYCIALHGAARLVESIFLQAVLQPHALPAYRGHTGAKAAKLSVAFSDQATCCCEENPLSLAVAEWLQCSVIFSIWWVIRCPRWYY